MNLNKKKLSDSVPLRLRQGGGAAPWWNKEHHAARRPLLLARNAAMDAVRAFFGARGFIEVETPVLQLSPGNETHLHAFSTMAQRVDGSEAGQLYLHTSPEFTCKKLLAAGEKKIFTLARTFRNREDGPLHAREFVMLEWYRADEPFDILIDDCQALVVELAKTLSSTAMTFKNIMAEPFANIRRLTVAQACADYAGIDIAAALDDRGNWKKENLSAQAQEAGIRVAPDDTAGDIFSRITVEKVEPHLGQGQMTCLTHYPLAEAALAKPCADDARFAERFELYACGIELANAFGELTDASEQRARFESAMNEKDRIYGERYPFDEDFLKALSQMPPACGIALGLERLIMLLTGAKSVQDVMWAS